MTVPSPATRMLVDGGRLIYTTALLNRKDPLSGIVGMPADLEQNDPDSLLHYKKSFPAIDTIPRTGDIWDGSFSIENALRLKPDVFVLSASSFDAARDAGTIEALERAGTPTVVIDYFVDPVKNTVPSVRLLGQLLDRRAEADAFVKKYQSTVDMVTSRLKKAAQPATPAFLWRAPGYFDCCATFRESNLGQLLTFAGGKNIADGLIANNQGILTPEAVIKAHPEVIIATGANWSPATPAKPGSFIPLGYDETAEHARSQLKAIVSAQPGFDRIPAVHDQRSYAIWHHYYDSPYNYIAIASFAKWLHPDLFEDVDPTALLKDLHSSFLPVSYEGTFWTSLA